MNWTGPEMISHGEANRRYVGWYSKCPTFLIHYRFMPRILLLPLTGCPCQTQIEPSPIPIAGDTARQPHGFINLI